MAEEYSEGSLYAFLAVKHWDLCRRILRSPSRTHCACFACMDTEDVRFCLAKALALNAPLDIVMDIYAEIAPYPVLSKHALFEACKFSDEDKINFLLTKIPSNTKRLTATDFQDLGHMAVPLREYRPLHAIFLSKRKPSVARKILGLTSPHELIVDDTLLFFTHAWSCDYFRRGLSFTGAEVDGGLPGVSQFHLLAREILECLGMEDGLIIHQLMKINHCTFIKPDHIPMLQVIFREDFFRPNINGDMLVHSVVKGI